MIIENIYLAAASVQSSSAPSLASSSFTSSSFTSTSFTSTSINRGRSRERYDDPEETEDDMGLFTSPFGQAPTAHGEANRRSSQARLQECVMRPSKKKALQLGREREEKQRRKTDEERRRESIWEAADLVTGFVEERWASHMDYIRIGCELTLEELGEIGLLDEREGIRACGRLVKAPVIHEEIAIALYQMLSRYARANRTSDEDVLACEDSRKKKRRRENKAKKSKESECQEPLHVAQARRTCPFCTGWQCCLPPPPDFDEEKPTPPKRRFRFGSRKSSMQRNEPPQGEEEEPFWKPVEVYRPLSSYPIPSDNNQIAEELTRKGMPEKFKGRFHRKQKDVPGIRLQSATPPQGRERSTGSPESGRSRSSSASRRWSFKLFSKLDGFSESLAYGYGGQQSVSVGG